MSSPPNANRQSSGRAPVLRTGADGEATGLLEQVRVLLERLALVQPSDVISLPIVVPTDLAALLDERARESGVPVPYLYSTCLLLGAWHAAHENGRVDIAWRIAAIIKRYAPEQEWARFVERHPEMAS